MDRNEFITDLALVISIVSLILSIIKLFFL